MYDFSLGEKGEENEDGGEDEEGQDVGKVIAGFISYLLV
jgi:hypothetical protein